MALIVDKMKKIDWNGSVIFSGGKRQTARLVKEMFGKERGEDKKNMGWI